MFIKENILLAISSIKANKMRSMLTMLGIIIGISSVIGIVSIGSAITASVSNTLGKMGASNIGVSVMQKSDNSSGDGVSLSSKEPEDSDLLSLEQINSFREVFKGQISTISISEEINQGRVKDGHLYANVSITGVNDGYRDTNNVKMVNGKFISDRDVKGTKKSAVVSDKLVKNIFKKNINPVGKEIKVYIDDEVETYTIVGVYKYESSSLIGGSVVSEKDISTNLYIPITTSKIMKKNKNYSNFTIMPKSNVDSEKLVKDIEKHGEKLYKNNKHWTLYVLDNKKSMESIAAVFKSISIGIAVIASIALLVGGIGVMNIMLVSVTERTREIGTRKALGARSGHIKTQFIIESVIICTIGGTIGMILGVGMGVIACLVLKSPISISIPSIIISFTFSTVIGVFFGYYPAKKAAQLDPIEALRYE
ncbi:ABC transporter permease [Clostridium beijerinckii]|uniref:ABC transporter permease n=1 Tax=Clostridium beijerinckii TaxID=1520 RepID=Q7WYT5_CLOBE|nr:ABC transporter permease [Clostridium beijerinckii]NRZ29571.1 putative ABC transport system permease protein [Clostridium beijerinckii]NYC00002.1 putative ABC transport system permease protein [Clostridium beijerinckii]OOM22377.1 macrolide export ATP-binding/permease protein MacB [Clostridium beijerinckii]QUN37928.1 ABC transporter permease [Clostridium beijerinckii]CAD97587.1 putative ABC transporter permease [Clostridium beijerinckii]